MSRLIARHLAVAPDAVGLARRVQDEPGFVFLWTAAGEGPSFIACRPAEYRNALDPEPELPLMAGANRLSAVPRWFALLPYEARRALERPSWRARDDVRDAPHLGVPWWARYGAVAMVSDRVLVVGDDPEAVHFLGARLGGPARAPGRVRAGELVVDPDEAHRARVVAALDYIRRGHVYQVNLARRFDIELAGSALDALVALCRHAAAPFAGAFVTDSVTVVASSPELFLRLDPSGALLTLPIKGTRPRGEDAEADRRLAVELDADEKERAELAMVVDVERNDLGRVARTGSVRFIGPPSIVTLRSIHHRQARVTARLRSGVSRTALLEAMLPSGSVTGAPKIRAMEVIAELEAARRGLYTGAFGYLGHDGRLELAMAIRTLTRVGDAAHYFAGGGIVADSDPDREVVETRWKAAQLLRLLG